MRDLHFRTKTHQAWAGIVSTADRGNFVFVHIRSSKTGRELNNYKLPAASAEQVQNIKSYTALVAFAKANQITDSVSDAHSGSDSASVTPCPVPAPAPAKSAAKGQGILFVSKTKKLNQNVTGLLLECLDSARLYSPLLLPLCRALHPYLPYQCGSYRPIRLLPIS